VTTPSTACAECRTLIGGYVLDALEPQEADDVRRHLAACPECAAEHARLDGIPALLALTSDGDTVAERPPAALEEAVLDRFAREHRSDPAGRRTHAAEPDAPPERDRPRSGRLATLLRPLRRPLPAAAAGALTAAAAAAVLFAFVGTGADLATQPGHTYDARLTGLGPEPAAHAYARLQTSSSGTQVRMKVAGLRGDPEQTYELWCIEDDGTKVSAGTFRVDARGQASVNLTTAALPGEYHVMSVERKTESPASGQRVMTGSIQY
jgi:hypothetical protein